MKSLILLTVLATSVFANEANSLKAYRVEILYPRGFRVIIPYNPQYQRIYFHGNINEEVSYYKPTHYIEELKQKGSGPWIYQNTDVILSPGDTINYYFVEIRADGTAYRDFIHDYPITQETPRAYYQPAQQSTSQGASSNIGNGYSGDQTAVKGQVTKFQSVSQQTDYVYSKDETEVQTEATQSQTQINTNTGGQTQTGATQATYQGVAETSDHVYSAGQTKVQVEQVVQQEESGNTDNGYSGDQTQVETPVYTSE